MIARIIGAFLCGVVLALGQLDNDPAICTYVTSWVTQIFEQSFNCRVAGNCTHVDFLSLSFTIDDFSVAPLDGSKWSWHCERYRTSFSLIDFLHTKKVGMCVELNNLKAYSQMQELTFDIMPHLQLLLASMPEDMPLVLTKLSISPFVFHAFDRSAQRTLSITGDCKTSFVGNGGSINVKMFDGSARLKGDVLIEKVHGACAYTLSDDEKNDPSSFSVECTVCLPNLPPADALCSIKGIVNRNAGSCTCISANRNRLNVQCAYAPSSAGPCFDLYAQMPCSTLLSFCKMPWLAATVTGDMEFHGVYDPKEEQAPLHGVCKIDELSVQNIPLFSHIQVDMHKKDDAFLIQGLIEKDEYGYLVTTGTWNLAKTAGKFTLCNKTDIKIPFLPTWCIEQDQLKAECLIDAKGIVHGTLQANCWHAQTHSLFETALALTADGERFCAKGHAGKNNISFAGDFSSSSKIKNLHIEGSDSTVLLNAHACDKHGEKWRMAVHSDLIKMLAERYCLYQIVGKGMLQICAMKSNNGALLKIEMADGALQLRETHNVLRSFNAFASVTADSFILHRARATVDEGTVSCQNGVMQWQNGAPSFIFLPVVFNDCMLMLSKDFIGQVSGSLMYTAKGGQSPHLAGFVLLDRALIKENIFSDALQQQLKHLMRETYLPTSDMSCQVHVATRAPARVKTSFLEAQMLADFNINGTLSNPCLSGMVEVVKGFLHFPYRSLHITRGMMKCLPYQLCDPTIELIAKGKVKKYAVTLRVDGSLQNHDIHLYTSPPLNEEQIVALLLVGSNEASLSNVAPALVMNNVANLVFGAARGSSNLERYFSAMLAPFKYVRFIPSFSDQSGRGGLRGGIEIELADRWRALIQKNFSLSEDTRFELEYQLSDDISLKAIRDEHHDISGEVEMRWKF